MIWKQGHKAICEWCGKSYPQIMPNQKYCSGRCKRNALRKRRRERGV